MISNWVKEMGIDAGCEMCLITEIANDRLAREVMEGEELAVELAQERARYRNEARHIIPAWTIPLPAAPPLSA